ncbi:tumor protein p53-inducible protein 13 isoform X1 [Anolis carolinensis]|uniref:tumor protein p53-inducible protein 13 isoform X1 n=1 Tax=Anolis carolinensis TaxID=28377 RepID=UPI002F2B6B96
MECRYLPTGAVPIDLLTFACFRTARLAGAGANSGSSPWSRDLNLGPFGPQVQQLSALTHCAIHNIVVAQYGIKGMTLRVFILPEQVSRNLVWTKRHRQRASNWPKWLSGGFRHLAGQPETTTPPPSVSKPETPVSTPVSTPEVRAGCRCPEEAEVAKAQQGKAEEARRRGVRLPTPRTEEAAWAASALTFLLVVLTVAILYTRLHRKCRRGRSLYWMVSGEEDRETVAAVIKRRLLSSQIRRKKRPRKKQQELLVSTSSDSSD